MFPLIALVSAMLLFECMCNVNLVITGYDMLDVFSAQYFKTFALHEIFDHQDAERSYKSFAECCQNLFCFPKNGWHMEVCAMTRTFDQDLERPAHGSMRYGKDF